MSSAYIDEDIKKSVWEGKIPVLFTLSQNDLTTHMAPSPITLMVPRNSYFPLITGVVRDHFSYSTLVISEELWLEYKGIPLKWHLPIGVLFDMLVADDSVGGGNNNSNNNNSSNNNNNSNSNSSSNDYHGSNSTPVIWNVTVHFQSYPEKVLLRCPNEESVQTYYKNVLKEANYIKLGDINKWNNLNINQSNELWDGLRLHDYEKFWSINKIFYPVSSNGYKHVPVRIIQNNKSPLQDLFPPFKDNGQEMTLESLFSKIPWTPASNNNNNNIEQSEQQQQQSTLLQSLKTNDNSSGTLRYLIQGIEPPLDTSLVWLGEYFSHPDNFLYIVILNPSSSSSSSSSNNNNNK
ncbi:hypothetical protein SAMD00019534_046470 [Acytostelium subglobosum LB1]|uniref:hypothetical protein n=1 Tax=Acytostelium subglobosum LB1 TaxID=1410327 RepID=UPI000644C7AC|nr:hypothetical protein SAMD00019534_046470 [Acytostelium subglobosum LB1]GAM21472.1 hypothetical protein SAMD00019534_046470 [Acytostelium subglobosum LB1]|eukprot:XP_012755591.1 hypothetical protein SAMD00019534_046470 [Acytostelium subglobosum LB1]